MRYRRLFARTKLTDEQQNLERYADRAGLRQVVIAKGIGDQFPMITSSKDLETLQSIIDNDLEPAVKLAERTNADFEASLSKRSKTPPGRTRKTRRKDPKPNEAKK